MRYNSFSRGALVLATALVVAAPVMAQDTQSRASSGAPASLAIGSDSLHGTKVYDTGGSQIGSISRLLIGTDGKVASVVITHGGTAGIGGKEIAVPWESLKLQRGDKDQIIATMQQDLLDKAPREDKAPAASPKTERR